MGALNVGAVGALKNATDFTHDVAEHVSITSRVGSNATLGGYFTNLHEAVGISEAITGAKSSNRRNVLRLEFVTSLIDWTNNKSNDWFYWAD